MAIDLLDWLVRATLACTIALLLALGLRRFARHRFGAGVAYALWLLVPVALLAVSLPLPAPDAAMPVAGAGAAGVGDPLPSVRVGMATVLRPVNAWAATNGGRFAPDAVVAAWAIGAVAVLLWLCWRQRRFMARLGALSRRSDGVFVAASSTTGPAAFGLLRARIVLPADFARRYSDEEAALIVAHERAHIRRGDIPVNALAAALRCLFWFNPLLHWAAGRFRFDQELACDNAVLARHPRSRRAYAGAMLKTQLAVLGLPVGCHWQSSQSLKERILMLKRPLPGRMRVRVGALAVCCAVAVTGMTAWAIQPASMAAPARRGIFHEQGVAFAYVRTTKDVLAKFRISGPSMGPGGDPDTTRVVLDRRADLRIGATDAIGPWELRLRGVGTPSNAPGVEWKLMRGAVVAARGQQPVSAGGRSTLMVTGDSIPALPLIELSRLPADGIVEYPGEGQPPSSMLTRESDGSWLDDGTGWVVGDRFGANGGRAVLLAHVDANGRVQRVEIESANPAGSLTQAAAIDLLKDKVYSPQLVNGKAVSSRIRIPLNYWRENPEPRKQVVASEASAAVVDTPAPRYPADALKKRIGGFVMLHLLVSADGKVKDVRVVSASPKGTFEDVSVEAAKRWTLQPPQEEGGKPVEGWVQVPITFDPNRSKDGTPVQG